MATTTPNYGWPVPTSSDLVKNGATAIEALGDAADATMATMTPKSIVDAKGDLIAASANDTPARLAVGNNGETLIADSTATTGLRWQGTLSASNPILNSAFQVWQRGTSFVPTGTPPYSADRWQAYRSVAGSTVTRQVTNDTTNLPFIQYCTRVQRDSGNTSTAGIFINQVFESVNSIPYAGRTVTLSFYARAGANLSSTSTRIAANLATGTGTDQSFWAGFTGRANPINTNVNLTTTWQRFTLTGTLAATATQIAVAFNMDPTGTAGANDYFEITGVQIDVGSVALPFRTYAGTIQEELAACQRYYQRITPATAGAAFSGFASTTTEAIISIPFFQTMRTAPTALEQTGTVTDYAIRTLTGNINLASAPTFVTASTNYLISSNSTAAAGLTAGNGVLFRLQNAGVAYLGWSAEL